MIVYSDVGNLYIEGTSKAETLENEFDTATINALAGNDKIENYGAEVSISGGAGNDTIINYGNDLKIILKMLLSNTQAATAKILFGDSMKQIQSKLQAAKFALR